MLGHILLTAVNAVAPIILLIALGYFLRQRKFLNGEFVATANKLVFNICIPVMLFVNIYDIESIADVRWDVVIYCTAIVTLLFGLGWVLARAFTCDNRRRGVLWQTAFRSNFAIIGLPLAQTLGGARGAAVAAVLSAFAIPAFNIYGVIALSAYTGKKKGAGEILKSIAKNPLMIGVEAGLLVLLIRSAQTELFGHMVYSVERDTRFLYTVLSNLKALTTPLSLIVLGAQCEFSRVKGMLKELVTAVTTRVVIAPAIAVCGMIALDVAGILPCGNGEFAATLALFGSPVAVSSAIMATNMGSDGQLATQTVVWSSLLSVATIFLAVCILMGVGVLTI